MRAQIQGLTISFLTLGGVLWVLYYFASALMDKLNALNSDVSKTIIGGFATVVVAVVTVVLGKIWEQKLKIAQDVREKKIPVYQEQLKTIFDILFASKRGIQTDDGIQLKAFSELTEKLIMWGGPGVIKAWQDFQKHTWSEETNIAGFAKFELFLLALRKDVGHNNKGFASGDFLRMFITDFDKHLEETAAKRLPIES